MNSTSACFFLATTCTGRAGKCARRGQVLWWTRQRLCCCARATTTGRMSFVDNKREPAVVAMRLVDVDVR